MIIPSRWRLPMVVAAATAFAGALAAVHYARLDLTLSHYDARGHLIVARRIIDSLTPGWQQVGAVWLPLPHLLNALPVQVDAWYRSGASAIVVSVIAHAAANGVVAWIVRDLTGSAWATVAAAAMFGLNPSLLYLQATPMTEPLFLACTLAAVAQLMAWTRQPGPTTVMGLFFAAACWTRYEAWPVSATAIPAAVYARWRMGRRVKDAVRDVLPIAAYPIGAALAFMVFSRVVVGEWFVSSGFFVPDPAYASPRAAAAAIWAGTTSLTNHWTTAAGAAGFLILLARSLGWRHHAPALVACSLAATAALPWLAFLEGHPFRVRYMVPLLAIEAVSAGVLVGVVRYGTLPLAIAVLGLAVTTPTPFDRSAPMVLEAQWERPQAIGRQTVSACLTEAYDGHTIMASMGSLGHYMQELSNERFAVRDFLHEGNGDLWLNALDRPRPYVGWILIEEKAEGGDSLAALARERPAFLEGFSRVCEGGGVALYRRAPGGSLPPAPGRAR
ncbi:MAG: hypothetical protein AB7N65_20760 [Vicinamibacterales bacterium]